MIDDLEREVREVLERRADEAAGRAGRGMPAEMRGRVRGRQARTVVMSGLAAALVAVGALAGARALVPSASREPGTGPPTSPFPMGPNPPMTVFASGEFRGLEWKFTAGRDGDVWCVEVEARTERGGESMGSCENTLQDRHLVATALYSPGFPTVVVSGFVSAEVDRVVFDFDAGSRVEGSVYPTPKEMKAPFDVFLIVVPQERPARGLVLAFDAEGNVLGRHGVYEPLGFFEAEDTYGNAVGYFQPQALDHELAWAKPGSEATIDGIRETAGWSLTRIWPEVRGWWEERPPADAPDETFLDWWVSYPVRGPEPARTADRERLASGEFRGHPWNLYGFPHSRGPCLEATIADTPYPMCNEGIPERFLLDFRVVGGPAEEGNLLIGLVSSETDRVLVDLTKGGDVTARMLSLPFVPGARAFVVEIPGHEGDLVALDRQRDEVWRESFRLIPQTEG